jgi:hypothetical protein
LKEGRWVGCTVSGLMAEPCIFAAASEECLVLAIMPSLWRIVAGSSSRSRVSRLLPEGLMVWRSPLARTGTKPPGLLSMNPCVVRTSTSSNLSFADAPSLRGHGAPRHSGWPTLCFAWVRRHSDSCPRPLCGSFKTHLADRYSSQQCLGHL